MAQLNDEQATALLKGIDDIGYSLTLLAFQYGTDLSNTAAGALGDAIVAVANAYAIISADIEGSPEEALRKFVEKMEKEEEE